MSSAQYSNYISKKVLITLENGDIIKCIVSNLSGIMKCNTLNPSEKMDTLHIKTDRKDTSIRINDIKDIKLIDE